MIQHVVCLKTSLLAGRRPQASSAVAHEEESPLQAPRPFAGGRIVPSWSTETRALLLLRVLGLLLVLGAYWAPWVAHPSAGLAIAEIDFNEFPKFMPQVRSGELEVWRESFYLTLLAPAVGLAVWVAGKPSGVPQAHLSMSPAGVRAALARTVTGFSASRWLMRLIALGLPLTPSIFNVFEAGEFQTQLRMLAVVATLILLSPLVRRLPGRLVALLLAAWFVYAALLPAREFLQLLPALADIYRRSITIGWGFYAALAGFALLIIAELWLVVAASVTRRQAA